MIIMCRKNIKSMLSKPIFDRFRLAISILIATIVLFSCQKPLVTDVVPDTGATVSFRVAGVKSKESSSKLGTTRSLSQTMDNLAEESNSPFIINKKQPNIRLDTITKISSIETSFGHLTPRPIDIQNLDATNLDKIASNSPMVSGRKFRIVILDLEGNIVKTVLASVDKSVNIDLVEGQQYNWYAYSFDDDNDIPAPTNESQQIETPTNKDLLYARSNSSIRVTNGDIPINIVFEHQLALLSIELDYDRLFASIPTNNLGSTSVTDNLNWTFTSPPQFLYKGTFSLKTGVISNEELYSVDINERIMDHATSENTKVAECYFVPPPAGVTVSNSFTVSLNTLNVKFHNTTNNVAVIEQPVTNTFSSSSNVKGDKSVAKFKLWYTFKKLNILHVTRSDNYAYAAQPKDLKDGQGMSASMPNPSPTAHHTSYNMIKASRNFGTLTNSIVQTNGFSHRRLSNNYRIDTALHLEANPTIPPPDIVIIGVYYRMDENDAIALVNYLNRGGVLFLMTDGVNDSDFKSQRAFFQKLFNNPATTLNESGFGAGSIYKLANINDEILNGPFGDIRGKHWGEDASATIALQNFPASEVTLYSESAPMNKTVTTSVGATMVKHNSRHFFWIGDGGFIACDEVSGAHGSPSNPAGSWGSSKNQPFATATSATASSRRHPYPYLSTHYEFYPVSRKFGYSGNGYPEFYHDVYNSTVFANFMSWAVANASFFGINTGGLEGDYHDF